jgi:hypothetical protein
MNAHGWLAVAALLAACGGGDDDDDDHDHDHDAALDDAAAADAAAADAPAPDASSPPDAPPGALPDMRLMAERMTDTWYVEQMIFAPEDCAIAEGCVDLPGTRTLLRFDTVTNNAGDADLHIGVPAADNPLFEYSSCHGHYHFLDYASYELLGPDGLVATGRKQAFCLMDTDQIDVTKPGNGYDCLDQGISSGWADTYYSGLTCQWIDITDLPAGEYTLRVTVNETALIEESDYTNNVLEFPVSW